MSIFDQILASAYYVFGKNLNSHIIRMTISFLRRHGKVFKRDELVMKGIKKYLYFDNETQHYILKDGYSVSDIGDFINADLVTLLHNLKKSRDNYYSGKVVHVESDSSENLKKHNGI